MRATWLCDHPNSVCAKCHVFRPGDLNGNDDVGSGEAMRQKNTRCPTVGIFKYFERGWFPESDEVVEINPSSFPCIAHLLISTHPLGHVITSLISKQRLKEFAKQ